MAAGRFKLIGVALLISAATGASATDAQFHHPPDLASAAGSRDVASIATTAAGALTNESNELRNQSLR